MRHINDITVVARPGYFGSKRRDFEASYDEQHGVGKWRECWQVKDFILDFNEAVMLYDDAYWVFIADQSPEFLQWLTSFGECYDSYTSNIRCGIHHDSEASPRHIQDVSVRRALLRLGIYFKKYRGSKEELYSPEELLHIRSKDTEGYVLSPMKVPFHMQEVIRGGNIRDWVQPGSVEAFWQSNKVIVTSV